MTFDLARLPFEPGIAILVVPGVSALLLALLASVCWPRC